MPVGALLAAVFGFIDYYTAPMPHKVKRTATKHMLLNLGITTLYAINLYLRYQTPETPTGYVLSVISTVALLYSGWLGGDLAYEHRVGVKEEEQHGGSRTRERVRMPVGAALTSRLCMFQFRCADQSQS